MDEGGKKALAKSLAQIAIASLSASLGGSGVGAALLAGGTVGANQWLDHLTRDWNKKETDFIKLAEKELPALAAEFGLDDNEITQEFYQALEALKKAPISAATFAELNFDADKAAARIAENSKVHRVASPDDPAHQILVRLYQLLPHDPSQIRSMELAFQQKALELLHSQNESLRAMAEPFGWAALLYTPSPPWRRRPSIAQLLDVAAAVVPYHPRAEDEALKTWLDSKDDIALRLYEAEGGAGKTRWMIEQCQRLSALGWRTGFLAGDVSALEAAANAYNSLFDDQNNTLIVVDYAETRAEQLNKLFMAAYKAPESCHIRIALLTRRVEGQWWGTLKNRLDRDAANLLEEYAPDQQELPPFVLDGPARATFYSRAWQAFHDALAEQGLEIKNEDPTPPALTNEHFKLPLFISLAALDRLLGGSGEGDEQALLSHVLRHEKCHWTRDGINIEAMSQAVATITLWQGASRDQVESLPQRWRNSTALGQANPQPLYALLNDLYGTDVSGNDPQDGQAGIAGLRPDRLGECLVEEVLKQDAEALAGSAFSTGVPSQALKNGFTVLSRLPLRATEHLRAVSRRLAEILKTEAGQDQGELTFTLQLLDQLPNQSLGLAKFAAEMTQFALDELKKLDSEEEQVISEVARLSNNLSVRLSALGQREAALTAAEEAVKLRRELAQHHPDAYTPDLAMSLNNVANSLSALGQREAALTAAQEAVKLRRELAQQHSDAYTPDLAMSLGALGQVLKPDAPDKAWACFAEGIVQLTPAFLRYPAGLAPLMGALARDYRAAAEQLNEAPDKALLEPVAEVFAQLQADEGQKS